MSGFSKGGNMSLRIGYILFFSLLLATGLNAGIKEADQIWQQRNELLGENAKKVYLVYKQAVDESPQSYEAYWKYSRALNWYGMNIAKDSKQKKEIFLAARDAGLTATQLKPDGAEGRVWLAVNWGTWGEANGVLNSLKAVPEIERNMNEVLTKDPTYDEAIAYRVLGRLYFKAPGPPLSIGDKEKALQYLAKSYELAPQNKKNALYYAEALHALKKDKEALAILDLVLSKPTRATHKVEESVDTEDLRELKLRIEGK